MLEEIARYNVKLLAVSKGQDIFSIKHFYNLGLRDFGESYAQELARKIIQAESLGLKDIKWHFIGAIQSNKIAIISKCDVIHSVAKVKQAELLSKHATKNIDIYLQINLSEEPNRQGFFMKDIEDALLKIKLLPKLTVKGFMAILPRRGNKEDWFLLMQNLKRSILEKNLLTDVDLSMGMSDDYLLAIKHGAGIVRIGSKLFGFRNG